MRFKSIAQILFIIFSNDAAMCYCIITFTMSQTDLGFEREKNCATGIESLKLPFPM